MEPGTSFAPEAASEPRPFARLRNVARRVATAFDRLPIRTRLTAASALLTFVILCAFAFIVGSITIARLRSQFDRQVEATASQLPRGVSVRVRQTAHEGFRFEETTPHLSELARYVGTYVGGHPVIRMFDETGATVAETPTDAPYFGPFNPNGEHIRSVDGYRVVTTKGAPVVTESGRYLGSVYVQYGQALAPLESTVASIELVLFLGVLGGAALCLLVGVMVARRAMAPIVQLTSKAAEIARTRDPSGSMPEPAARDEVSELARTLSGMLRELDSAHAETEATLARQRQFVADASHELRTPLTSVLANLELLADSLRGEQGEAAHSALRSSQRMRRLVADLLLLARSDVGRVLQREPIDLSQIVTEASAELGPISADHEIVLQAEPAEVEGIRDELYRMALNLIENAVRHTPPGTEIDVRTDTIDGRARLIVKDNGPGIPADLRQTLFERFVRGAGDRGGSFGLGLAIVKAVVDSSGGSVTVTDANPADPERRGACFTVLLPLASGQVVGAPAAAAASPPA